MKTIFIINGYAPDPYAEGKLTASYTQRAKRIARTKGYHVLHTFSHEPYDVNEEIQKHVDADIILMQFPIYWMGAPWGFKKYIDHVYTEGMDGRMCDGDGRGDDGGAHGYANSGALNGKYMFSVTFNAPHEAFDNPDDRFFKGRSVDDMLYPMHLNAQFMGLSPLPTFAAFDVMKKLDAKGDFERFEAHLNAHL